MENERKILMQNKKDLRDYQVNFLLEVVRISVLETLTNLWNEEGGGGVKEGRTSAGGVERINCDINEV